MDFLTKTNDIPGADEVPSYLLAADNHNIGNTRGGSWLEPDTWSQKFENAGKMIAVGMMSGANSFYNTFVTVGNWMGDQASLNDTKEWISSIDADLGVYYDKNREAADLVGFIAGSLVPGLGGVKILNAGQTALKAATSTGFIGGNLARATGLLVPRTEMYVSLAASEINAASASFRIINTNSAKALASGFWQNTLEAAAFETAVQATMFKSPILEAQDNWDILKNIAIGGAVGGVIGGAFSAAKTFSGIKKAVAQEELALKPFSSRNLAETGTSPSQKLVLLAEDRDFGAIPLPDSPNYQLALKQYNDKVRRIINDERTTYHQLVSGGDSEIGNMMADASHMLPHQVVMQNVLHADEIARPGVLTAVERDITKAAKEGKATPELQVTYVKLTGEGVGVASDSAPRVFNLADNIRVTSNTSGEREVMDVVRAHKFSPEKLWNAATLTGSKAHLEAEARHIWADKVLKEIKHDAKISQYDIPLLERAYKDDVLTIKLADDTGAVVKDGFASKTELWNTIVESKQAAAAKLLENKVLKRGAKEELESAQQEIAKITNVRLGFIEGDGIKDLYRDMQAWQTANSDYIASLTARGLSIPDNLDTRFLPSYAKVTKRIENMEDVDGHVLDGMAYIKQQQQQLKLAVDNVVAKAVGPLAENIPTIPDSVLLNANRYGAGAGLFSFSNGGYGSLESVAQLLGSQTKTLKTQFRQETADTLQGALVNLGTKLEAAVEFETINQKVTRSAKQWVRHSQGEADDAEHFLITTEAAAKFKNAETGLIDFDSLSAELPESLIQIRSPESVAFIDAHINRTGTRTTTYRELRAAQGLTDHKDSAVFRPIRPSLNDYPYFAFVKDPRVTGQGHTTMIHAASESKLAEMIDKVPSEYRVLTKKDVEDFKHARNEYEYQRTLHENYIDSDLKNRGIFSNFYTKTNPQKIVDDILNQHVREDDVLAIELMRAKNQKAFDWLEDQGNTYTKLEQSQFGTFSDRLERAGKNPYLDVVKTALDISKASENPLLYGFNRALDSAVSRAVATISEVWQGTKSKEDLGKINALLDTFGMNTGYRDAATDLLANHTAPRGELTKFVRGANAVLSRLTLGLDPLNAVNNFVGANVLRMTELKQITDAVKAGDTVLAGELGKLMKVSLPGDVGEITAPTKLVARAIQNYWKDDGSLLASYKAAGFVKDATTQFRNIVDDFTLKGTETVSELNKRLTAGFERAKKLTEVGEKVTGNRLAEEFNRFISADVMRQITDLGVSRGLLTKSEQQAYINTFVNRVEGNTLASQRPLMFQGPIGQAIGLFQSYQFNLMQQMFRYVGEGTAKDAAMLLGLQGTFYGIQGLPAFQFINQHVIGTLSGNQKHVDAYDSTYGVAGQQLGDLLLYGLASNVLQANLYSRGDINPRQVTILPTSLPEVPFIGAFGKFLGSVKNTVSRINSGAPVWESMLQGLEHNGLSRPLAGLAQTLQATGPLGVPYSTTNKGSILFSNDLMSWATAVRVAGGRPLDEAIVNDGVYRIQAYQQYDMARRRSLGESIKLSSIEGNIPEEDQIIGFAKKYAETGGKQANFNKFMMNEYKAANTSQSQKIQAQLNHPFAQKMQLLMGGSEE